MFCDRWGAPTSQSRLLELLLMTRHVHWAEIATGSEGHLLNNLAAGSCAGFVARCAATGPSDAPASTHQDSHAELPCQLCNPSAQNPRLSPGVYHINCDWDCDCTN